MSIEGGVSSNYRWNELNIRSDWIGINPKSKNWCLYKRKKRFPHGGTEVTHTGRNTL